MDAALDWSLTTRYSCPECGKRYAVVEWKKNPKCRQCGSQLCADTQQGKQSSERPQLQN
jgi:DNA-directed RNA polymerase subunit RPC12/RpoP